MQNQSKYFIKYFFSVLPLNIRLIFSRATRISYQEYAPRDVLEDYTFVLTEKISKLESNLAQIDKETEYLMNKPFKPSKTAQNGLNFITKEDEINLANQRLDNDEIISIFKIIFVLIRQNTDQIDPALLPEILINKVFKKLKIDNLSKITLIT